LSTTIRLIEHDRKAFADRALDGSLVPPEERHKEADWPVWILLWKWMPSQGTRRRGLLTTVASRTREPCSLRASSPPAERLMI